MSSKGQSKFAYVLIAWLIGLMFANAGCGYLSSLEWEVLAKIPAIESYARAASPTYRCTAKGIWTYAWLVAPLFFIWLAHLAYSEPLGKRVARQKYVWVIFIISIFALFFAAAFFGIYEPYPGTGRGRWTTIYRESGLGVLTGTAVIWWGVFSAFFVSALGLIKVLKYR